MIVKKSCANCIDAEKCAKREEIQGAYKPFDDERYCAAWLPNETIAKHNAEVAEKMEQIEPTVDVAFRWINGSTGSNIVVEAIALLFSKQHRYLQSEMIMFLIRLLDKIAKISDEHGADLRNEWAMFWCRKASDYSHDYFDRRKEANGK